MLGNFVLRLLVAGLLGAAIGIEREYRAKGAGFRTHFLVAIGSALMMIVSAYGFSDVVDGVKVHLDPGRIAGQVVTGIGFIGAGTIILQKQIIRGLTTAAGIFAVAGIGLTAGAGMYWLAVIAAGMVLTGMEVMVFTHRKTGGTSTLIACSSTDPEQLKKIAEEALRTGFRILSYETTPVDTSGGTRYRVEAVYHARRRRDEEALLHYMHSLKGCKFSFSPLAGFSIEKRL